MARPNSAQDSAAHRPEGFPGQLLVVLPAPVLENAERDLLLADLFPAAAGFFPRVPGHLVERARGLDECVLIRVLAGSGWVRSSSRRELSAGDWLILPAGLPHAYGASDTDPWSVQWVHFRGRAAAAFVEWLGAGGDAACLRPGAPADSGPDLAEIAELLAAGYTRPLLLRAAAHLRMVLTLLDEARRETRPSSALEAVRASERWMRAHLTENPCLARLAAKAGLSVPHYAALFRRHIGYPPRDYFLRLKVQRAAQLLDTTNLRVSEIAEALGWGDAYYFSRCFRKITGHSPSDYRAIVKS